MVSIRTVLIVEDEPNVLFFLEDSLENQGFKVISARSGGEALNILGNGLEKFDALVCDIRIGDGIDGWEIARCAREIIDDLPVVFVTGDSAGDWVRESVTNSTLLQKPFSGSQLVDSVARVIALSGEAIA